ncbi:MAG: hypothetical protein JXQ90_05580 [Cyclobacteriaceae bacterium]
MATHYCGGTIAEIEMAMGKADVGCGMEESAATEEGFLITKQRCCQDKYLKLSLEDDFRTHVNAVEVSPSLLVKLADSFHNSVTIYRNTDKTVSDRSPPIVNQNRRVLLQIFII